MDLSSLIECLGDPGCLINQTTSALIFAMLLFLIASGLSLIFGVLGVMNFAHGALYMLGPISPTRSMQEPQVSLWPLCLVA